MEYRRLNTRYKELVSQDHPKHQPYQYREKGILHKVMPAFIVETKNKITKAILLFVEDVFIDLLDYVDYLRNFKNWNYWRY